MGMSTHVVGFRPPDEKWRKMKAVWEACEAAGQEIPENVSNFFEGEAPDECGVEVLQGQLEKVGAIRRYKTLDTDGYEVVVASLPADVKIIRFMNCY